MLEGLLRRIYARRADAKLEALVDSFEHHIADLQAQVEYERSRADKLLCALIGGGGEEKKALPDAIPPRRNWNSLRKVLEAQDRIYARAHQSIPGEPNAWKDQVGETDGVDAGSG